MKKWRKNNPESVKKSREKWQKNNPEKIKTLQKTYREGNREKIRERNRLYYKNNPGRMKERRIKRMEYLKGYLKIWRKNNNNLEYFKMWRKNNSEYYKTYRKNNREKINKWYKNERRINIKYNLNRRMASMIKLSLQNNKTNKHWEDLVEYNLEDLIKQLKKTMPEGYNWNDYLEGKLHIDHIIPISAFNFDCSENPDFKNCWALDNLQLLPAKENLIKHNKLARPFKPALKLKLFIS